MTSRTSETSKRKIEAIYPLTPMQQGMLFHTLYAPSAGEYVGQFLYHLEGALDVESFKRAWQRVLERHPVLRTSFFWENPGKELQIVLQGVRLACDEMDWRAQSEGVQQERLRAYLEEDRRRGFDLAKAPLMRLSLIRTGDKVYKLIWTCHHILLDGWSLPLVLREVLAFYEAFSRGQDLRLETVPPYRNYIQWLQRQKLAEAETFWRDALKGFNAPTPLPFRKSAESANETGYKSEEISLSAETTARLLSATRLYKLTLNTAVQGAWALLLGYYNDEEEVVFGATVSGRPADLPGVERMVGLFINTLPVRAQTRADDTLLTFLQRLQAQQAEARQYEYSPLWQIQGWSELARTEPLFESLFIFENYPVVKSSGEGKRGADLSIRQIGSVERVNYPLTLIAWQGQELHLRMGYNDSYFEPHDIRRMLSHLRVLLESVADNPERRLSSLSFLTETERRQLLIEWNETRCELPDFQCIHEVFEAQAERAPDATAVVFEHQALTYGELNGRANKLAHYLRRRGVAPETVLGLCVERSVEMLVGLLGILKAGGAYLPLDSQLPASRLSFMLEDARAAFVVTQRHLADKLPVEQQRIVCLDDDWEIIDRESEQNPSSVATGENLAYVIYTSGSTGRPKGVMIRHRALFNFTLAFIRLKELSPGERHIQFIALSFDAAGEEIYPTLASGATLVLHRNPTKLLAHDLIKFCQEERIAILHQPPSVWHQLVDEMACGRIELPATLRMLVMGGESPDVERLQVWAELTRRRIKILFAYGPSEATITSTAYKTMGDDNSTRPIEKLPIGRPLENMRAYVLDSQLRPLPAGVRGELYIGGEGLARGYLSSPALTAERFIPDSLSGEAGARLYRTGDMVRYRENGELEYIGRRDEQVKVRGYRIELGEVEAAIQRQGGIKRAAVVVKGEGERRHLVAYVEAERDEERASKELIRGYREELRRELPDYMMPAHFVLLEEMPVTAAGKVDRQKLPEPTVDGSRDAEHGEGRESGGRTAIEEVISGIWEELLGVVEVGVDEDFFELGGHSLLATQVISRVRQAFGVEVALRRMFEEPTVRELSREVEALRRAGAGLRELPEMKVVDRGEGLPLSFAQQRLWYLDQLEPSSALYNLPVAIRLNGRLNVVALAETFRELTRRHEVLRTSFANVDGAPLQVIHESAGFSLPLIDLEELSASEREAEVWRIYTEETARAFNLSACPLLRANLLRLSDEEHVMTLVMHHVVSDGWSMGVMVREIGALYRAFSEGRSADLPELPVQYADFAHWQREWLKGDVLERQLAYWEKQLAGAPPLLELPTDCPRPPVQRFRGAAARFALPADLSQSLKALSRREGATLFMTLLTAFQTLLARYSGQEDIVVGTPTAGRDLRETEGLIGFFVNTLVLRAHLDGDPTFRELLGRVREVCLGAYAHGEVPFEMLVERLRPERNPSYMPLFQVMFILQNAPLQALELPGLRISLLDNKSETAKFDLVLEMNEGRERLSGRMQYDSDLFNDSTIRRMLAHFEKLLTQIVERPDAKISTLKIISDEESEQLSYDFNDDLEAAFDA